MATGHGDRRYPAAVTTWDAHKLAERREQLELRPGQKVVAVADLPGVPSGTRGEVLLAKGFAWLRYRVRFANGVELPHLDGRHVEAAAGRRGRRRKGR